MRKIALVALATIMATLIVASEVWMVKGAIITEKPYYTKADVIVFFTTEDTAKMSIKFSLYGVQANDIEKLINKTGEANYTKSIIENIKKVVGNSPYIGGSYEFYPIKESARIVKEILDKEKGLKRIDLIYEVDLRAKRGAPTEREGRKGIIYSTREDYTNISFFYVGRQVDLLNLTVILPPTFVVSYVRPNPSLVYPLNVSGDLRAIISWLIRDPLVDKREQSYTGWFHIGIHNLTSSELDKVSSIYREMVQMKKANLVLADESRLSKLEKFFSMGYKSLVYSPQKLGYEPDAALKLVKEAGIGAVNWDVNLFIPLIAVIATAVEVIAYLHFRKKGKS